MTGFADNDANQIFNVRRFGKRAEIQPDNGFFPAIVWYVLKQYWYRDGWCLS